MRDRKLRFGIVGAGNIAHSYVQAFEKSGAAELAGVADIRPEAARALSESAGCTAYGSHLDMAAEARLDAVVICTPPSTHEEIAVDLMDRKIHVLCEKPLSVSSASARNMIEASRRAGVKMTMASKFRYVDDVIRAKSIVSSGILGEIVLFENAFTSRINMTRRWNADPALSGGGVLMDNGTHSLDLTRFFLGPLSEIQVVEGKRSQGLVVEDTVHIFVHSLGGAIASIDLSWSINKEQDSYIRIYGSHGTVVVGWKESKYRQQSSVDWVQFGRGYDKVQAFRSQIENFAGAITGEQQLLITPDDALASVEVVEAAYAGMRLNHWTAISRPPASATSALEELRMTA